MNIRSFLKNLEINSSGIRYHMRALLVILSDEVVHEERLPDGPSTNLLRLVVTPFLIGRSEMSMCSGLPLMRSAILMPNGEGESI